MKKKLISEYFNDNKINRLNFIHFSAQNMCWLVFGNFIRFVWINIKKLIISVVNCLIQDHLDFGLWTFV